MLRLAKYLKPYLLIILVSIALLFVQANADLALPDYMSKIVNNGIQQGGVENAIPKAIRQSEMDKLFIFMSSAEQELVLSHYTLVDQNSPDYEKYVTDYPALAEMPVYILNPIEKTEITVLNPILGKALLVVSTFEKIQADPASAAALGEGLDFDPSMIPAGMDLFDVLKMLPADQLTQIISGINEKFAGLGDSMVNQMAVASVKSEYEALGMDNAKLQSSYILNTGLVMLLISLLSGAATIIVGWLSSRTAAGLARDLRKDVFKKVESFSNAELDNFSTASLITRTTNDVTQIQMVTLMMLRMVFYAPIIGIGGIIRAIGKSPNMWWILAVAVVTLLGLILVVFSIALPKFKIIQSLVDRLNLVTRENLSGMMVIRAFNKQSFEEGRFDIANQDLNKNMLFIGRVMATMMPVMMFIMNAVSILIIWVGAKQVALSTIQVGDMMAFLQYAMQILFSFLMMSFMFIMLPRASVSGARIADVLETKATIVDPLKPETFSKPVRGKVEFRNVSFRYPDAQENVLCNINFTALPGQTTAIIGSTGSGKSSVVNLIPRFYDVTEGDILIDGVNIRSVRQSDLRDQIGYIPQKGNLFSGTIDSNLRYADENASEEALINAVEIAQASEFINAKPEGFQTEISQGGANVSGGQKQRLAIARALVKRPPIYIFDDSFSALDFKTDSALRAALKKNTADSTVLIVTQRVATIKNADQIIVVEQGEVVGSGQHTELMENCETYREIALSQLSKEELV
ncbi:MAG: ABC transporter [Chloroflexi bacterium HGW-Chloroflexi-10]|nr:MAG: ABC transporter [Chloroflexi bacterium HGW-Chloroflexi-10]